MTGDCEFATPRLTIRPARIGDAEALHPGYADAAAMRYGAHPPHASLAETLAKLQRNFAAPDWRMWVFTPTGDDVAIGTLAVHAAREGVAEIGYSILPARAGRGYAREAVAALLDRLFRGEGHRRVYADIDPDNMPSRRLVEALGFRVEGVLRDEWKTHIGVRDAVIYGLLAREWPGLSSSASSPA